MKLELDLLPDDREALTSMLRQSFPDTAVDDHLLASIALTAYLDDTSELRLAWDRYRDALDAMAASLGLTCSDGTEMPRLRVPAGDRGGLRYYRAHATHDREAPDYDPFTGHLGMVRVGLPPTTPHAVATAIGDVLPEDHLPAPVAEVQAKYGRQIAGVIERVDVITPSRPPGARFAAIPKTPRVAIAGTIPLLRVRFALPPNELSSRSASFVSTPSLMIRFAIVPT